MPGSGPKGSLIICTMSGMKSGALDWGCVYRSGVRASTRAMAARTSGQSVTSSGSMLSSTSLPARVQPGTRALSPRLVGHVLVITSAQLPSDSMRVLRVSMHVPSGGEAPASRAPPSTCTVTAGAGGSRVSRVSCGRHDSTWSAMTQAPVTSREACSWRMTEGAVLMCGGLACL
jgi:hypothetical protein